MTTTLTKSEKSQAELASGSFCLDLKSRQGLILADGQRTLEHMQQLRPGLDVAGIVRRLVAEGYLSGDRPATPPSEEPSLRPEQLAQIQSIIIDSTRNHLGLLGGDLIRKAEAIRSDEQLRSCVAQWNMALRSSRLEQPVADQYLRDVQQVLAWHH